MLQLVAFQFSLYNYCVVFSLSRGLPCLGQFHSSTVSSLSMPAFQKVCPKCASVLHVRKSRCPCGHCFSTKPKLALKPENVMKSSESRKNSMAECQARKRGLESSDQSHRRRLTDSKCHALKRARKLLLSFRVVSKLILNIMPTKKHELPLKNPRYVSKLMLNVIPKKEPRKHLKRPEDVSKLMLNVMPKKKLRRHLKRPRDVSKLMFIAMPKKELRRHLKRPRDVSKLMFIAMPKKELRRHLKRPRDVSKLMFIAMPKKELRRHLKRPRDVSKLMFIAMPKKELRRLLKRPRDVGKPILNVRSA